MENKKEENQEKVSFKLEVFVLMMQYAAFKLSTTLYYFSVSNSGELAALGTILGIIGGVTFAVLFIAKIFKTISLAVSEGIKSASKK